MNLCLSINGWTKKRLKSFKRFHIFLLHFESFSLRHKRSAKKSEDDLINAFSNSINFYELDNSSDEEEVNSVTSLTLIQILKMPIKCLKRNTANDIKLKSIKAKRVIQFRI